MAGGSYVSIYEKLHHNEEDVEMIVVACKYLPYLFASGGVHIRHKNMVNFKFVDMNLFHGKYVKNGCLLLTIREKL